MFRYRFFSQSKMSSFQRQLNLYGFLRQNTGRDRGSYYHELFLRARPDLPKIMVRTRVKGIGMGRTNKIEKEPDFYQMPPCRDGRNSNKNNNNTTLESTAESFPSMSYNTSNACSSTSIATEESSSMQSHESPQPTEPTFMTLSAQPNRWMPNVPPRVSPSSFSSRAHTASTHAAAVVTPMPKGRQVFNARNRPGLGLGPGAIEACRSSVLLPEQEQRGSNHRELLSNPIRTISSQLPMIPLNTTTHHPEAQHIPYLPPRYEYNEDSNNNVSLEDTALFEGLEFQVVDDDSLEQFESELISVDGSASL